MDIYALLFENRDIKYRDFTANLCPTLDKECIIGVRTPILKDIAKDMIKSGESDEFISKLPHRYFEENQLHAFIISEIKVFEKSISETENFLPYIDNWATCDQLVPKAFKKNSHLLEKYIEKWMVSSSVYTVRFAVCCAMRYFLDENFKREYLSKIASLGSDKYYINMVCAWFFATALAKQYDETAIYFKEKLIKNKWVHNKAISKANDSFRISDDKKRYLKTLKI